MNQQKQFKETTIDIEESTETVINSLCIAPASFSKEYQSNNPVYKSELTINRLINNKNESCCSICKQLINDPICSNCQLLQTKICLICNKTIINEEIIKFNSNNYHSNCFNCSKCKINLINNKNIFIINNNELCCSQCHNEYFTEECFQCHQPISKGKLIIYKENKYHLNCFRCFHCDKIIEEEEFSTKNGKPVCCECNDRYFAPKCSKCFKTILNEKFTIYKENKYHLNCFRCSHCDKIIDGEEEFSTKNGKLICVECDDLYFASKCFKCLKSILDGKSIIYNENKYHSDCFRCSQCNKIINEKQFHTHNSKPCCSECYDLYFALKCFQCLKPITDRYTTYQQKHFHIQCFICSECHQIIPTGDKFLNRNGNILCSTCAKN